MKRVPALLAALLCCAAILAGCAASEPTEAAESAPETTAVITEETAPAPAAPQIPATEPDLREDYEIAYEAVCKRYYAAWTVPALDWINDQSKYHAMYGDLQFSEVLSQHHQNGNTGANLYYALYDLDGNGIPELFLGNGMRETGVRIADVFVWDGQAAQVIAGFPMTLLADGTIVQSSTSGLVERVCRLGADGYTLEDVNDGQIELGSELQPDYPCGGGAVAIPGWKPAAQLTNPTAMPPKPAVDAVLENIRFLCSLKDYDSNMETYDSLFLDLGLGIPFLLTHRNNGYLEQPVWSVLYDIDSDGLAELCVGIAPNAQAGITPIVFYDFSSGSTIPITGAELEPYIRDLTNGLPVNWMAWECVYE